MAVIDLFFHRRRKDSRVDFPAYLDELFEKETEEDDPHLEIENQDLSKDSDSRKSKFKSIFKSKKFVN